MSTRYKRASEADVHGQEMLKTMIQFPNHEPDEMKKAARVTFTTLSQGLLKTDPFTCLLCGAKMAFGRALPAVPLEKLIANAGAIARMSYIG